MSRSRIEWESWARQLLKRTVICSIKGKSIGWVVRCGRIGSKGNLQRSSSCWVVTRSQSHWTISANIIMSYSKRTCPFLLRKRWKEFSCRNAGAWVKMSLLRPQWKFIKHFQHSRRNVLTKCRDLVDEPPLLKRIAHLRLRLVNSQSFSANLARSSL